MAAVRISNYGSAHLQPTLTWEITKRTSTDDSILFIHTLIIWPRVCQQNVWMHSNYVKCGETNMRHIGHCEFVTYLVLERHP